ERFFDTLAATGGHVAQTRTFPDHHPYADAELAELAAEAGSAGLDLVTTAKDAIRLRGGSVVAAAFRANLSVLEIDAAFALPRTPRQIIAQTIAAWQARRHGG